MEAFLSGSGERRGSTPGRFVRGVAGRIRRVYFYRPAGKPAWLERGPFTAGMAGWIVADGVGNAGSIVGYKSEPGNADASANPGHPRKLCCVFQRVLKERYGRYRHPAAGRNTNDRNRGAGMEARVRERTRHKRRGSIEFLRWPLRWADDRHPGAAG